MRWKLSRIRSPTWPQSSTSTRSIVTQPCRPTYLDGVSAFALTQLPTVVYGRNGPIHKPSSWQETQGPGSAGRCSSQVGLLLGIGVLWDTIRTCAGDPSDRRPCPLVRAAAGQAGSSANPRPSPTAPAGQPRRRQASGQGRLGDAHRPRPGLSGVLTHRQQAVVLLAGGDKSGQGRDINRAIELAQSL